MLYRYPVILRIHIRLKSLLVTYNDPFYVPTQKNLKWQQLMFEPRPNFNHFHMLVTTVLALSIGFMVLSCLAAASFGGFVLFVPSLHMVWIISKRAVAFPLCMPSIHVITAEIVILLHLSATFPDCESETLRAATAHSANVLELPWQYEFLISSKVMLCS